MKLYVCFSTKGGSHHACARAYQALSDAGIEPEVQKVHGSARLPKFLQTKGRRELYKQTGSYYVPVLWLDDGSYVQGSNNIIATLSK